MVHSTALIPFSYFLLGETMAHHLAYSSAAAVLGAGMYGYFRAGSKASLAGGALLSCAFVASGLATSQSTENIGSAFLVAAAAGAACTAIGARRWSRVRNYVVAIELLKNSWLLHSLVIPLQRARLLYKAAAL